MAEVPTLEELDLYDTQVADLSPLVGHPRLTSLNVSHTRIADLALAAGIAGLKSIYAAGDRLVDVSPIAGHDELVVVDISDNDITSLAPLADVAWQRCGTLVTKGNSLDAASTEDVLPALCDRDVVVESDDGDPQGRTAKRDALRLRHADHRLAHPCVAPIPWRWARRSAAACSRVASLGHTSPGAVTIRYTGRRLRPAANAAASTIAAAAHSQANTSPMRV